MIRKSLLLTCLFLLLSCSCYVYGMTVETQPTGQVVLSREQYNNLKLTVTELETNLTMLENNSKSDKKQIAMLKEYLTTTQTAIEKATISLNEAKNSSDNLKNNLQTLKEQINVMNHKLAVKERQNKTGWIVAGIALIASIRG